MPELKVKLISNKNIWENFLGKNEEANFLQSWNWGKFHENLGKKVYFFGLLKKNIVVGCALAVKEEAKRGAYLSIAGGPIVDWNKTNHFNTIHRSIAKQAKEEKCNFIRMRCQEIDGSEIRKVFKDNGFCKAPMHLTADLTIQLDLAKSEEQLLSEMRKNTRYEIKKAIKVGIRVEQSKNPNDIKTFYHHQLALAKKHNFVPFSYEFLHEQFKVFVKDNQALLFHAYKDKSLLASAFVILYGKEAVYHYGISTEDNAKLPGSYACQWAAILEAKKRGMKRYNLWGVALKEETHHRFYGVSIFKRGFNGQEVQYLPTQDLPLNWKYYAIYILETGRKKIRKL